MDPATQPYRLEVALKRVYGLRPAIASTSSRLSVEVRFLDFPSIVIHPQGYVVGDSVAYNVCHKADFRMTPQQAATAFPAICQCQLIGQSSEAVAGTPRWSCPCALLPSSNGGAAVQRSYANYVISNAVGETVGYAEMSCTVQCMAAPSPMPPPPSAALQASGGMPPSFAPPVSPPPLSFLSGAEPHKATPPADQGKPYIVRVVVGESDRVRRANRSSRFEAEGGDLASSGRALENAARDVRRASSPHRVPASTAGKDSLLFVLQYDVAYQLQSLSETVAAALQREHDVLSQTPLTGESKDGAVAVSRLTKSIDRNVATLVKLANIVLQVANQLVDKSPAPLRTGTNREIKEAAHLKRNPVNRLPAAPEGTVSHYLQYDVLYQLQCLGTNLSYVTLVYRDALDTPLSSIPKQHAEFCVAIGDEVQHLTKLLNVLIQSSVDGVLGRAAPAAAVPKSAKGDRRKEKRKHRDVTPAAKAKPSGRSLSLSDVKSALSSRSGSTYSSFSSDRSSRSSSSGRRKSSLSTSDSSLNRPMTPVSAPRAAALTPPNVAPPPLPVTPSVPSQHLQPQLLVTPAPVSPDATRASPPPPVNPPPHTVAIPLQPVASSPSFSVAVPQGVGSPSLSGPPAVSPFSWVNGNTYQAFQSESPSTTSPMSPTASSTFGVPAPPVPFSTQPAVPAVAASPPLSATQLPVTAPPRPSLPFALAPPTVIPAPSLAAAAPPPPLASVSIPVPIPVPR